MSMSDQILIDQAVSGDREALTRLIERHGPVLRDRFRREIPQRWEAMLSLDDLMQETYTDAFLDITSFVPRGPGSFEGWLSSIARHNLLNAIEMLGAEKRGGSRRPIQGNPEESFVQLYEIVGRTTTTPSRAVARQEARLALQSAIGKLPEDYRRVVQLYDIEGRPAEEVSNALSRSVGAVFMLRARAHRALGKMLGAADKYMSERR